MVKKISSCSKNIEHGQNIFELADGISNSYEINCFNQQLESQK